MVSHGRMHRVDTLFRSNIINIASCDVEPAGGICCRPGLVGGLSEDVNGRNARNWTGDTNWLHRQSIRRGRLPISSILPNAELSPWANFCCPGLVEGILGGARMDTTCIAGRGLRACPIVGRFDGVIIACRRECYFVTAGPNSRHERRNGRLGD